MKANQLTANEHHTTTGTAKYWAKLGTDVLFSESDPFAGRVCKVTLEKELYKKILRNLVTSDTHDLTEKEFQECITLSTKLN